MPSPRLLALLRHGESLWNLQNRFTGWTDVPLTDTGRQQAKRAGLALLEAGFRPGVAHTSMLARAQDTLTEAAAAAGWEGVPARRAWELNERHYGALQGRDKAEAEREFGAEQTLAWRRGFNDRPPLVPEDDPRNPKRDPRYANAPPERLPRGESLADTLERVVPYWTASIAPDLAAGPVLVAAHGNSLRALVMHLEGLTPEAIRQRNLPTGIPLLYRLDPANAVLSSAFLADEEELRSGLKKAAHRP